MKDIERIPNVGFAFEKLALEESSGAQVTLVPSKIRENSYTIFFDYEATQVTAAVVIEDGGKKMVIHALQADNMGGGFGTKVLHSLLAIAKEKGMRVVAKEVLPASQVFWEGNKFVRMPEPNPKDDFEYKENE